MLIRLLQFFRPIQAFMLALLALIWALPITLFGLLVITLALPSHPHVALLRINRTSALCAWGGWLDVWLQKHPFGSMYAATLGHVVIARDLKKMCYYGAHEYEHVRQTERWGILLPLAYVLNGLWQMAHKRHFYRDNIFEVAAYRFSRERFESRIKPRIESRIKR